jgi:D-alanyl-D-alanine carboxypeptidase
MKKRLLIVGAVGAIILGVVLVYAALGGFAGPLTSEEAQSELEALLRETVEGDDAVRNGVFLVDAPDLDIEGVWAAGIADERDGTPMTTETPFISASIGKLFTAATVLALVEEGVLSLDDNVTEWLDPAVYAGIPVGGGDRALSEVTIRRLLGQRSGIPDYFEGETADGTPNVMELLEEEPDRTWTPLSLLAYTKEHFEPAGVPGELFTYADTNYDLLGLIVEEATGEPFHEIVEEEVLQPLGLRDTWYYARTDPPRPDLAPYADVWLQDANAARTASLSLD